MLKRHFRKVDIIGEIENDDRPVLLIGNHFSWWDGFIAVYINLKVFRKKFYVVMLEEQLSTRNFLSKAGAFSIRPGTRGVVESMQYASGILRNGSNILVVFPQGEIHSAYLREFRFERGVAEMAGRSGSSPRVIFYFAIAEYFSHKTPRLDIFLGEYEHTGVFDIGNLEHSYNSFCNICIGRQKEG